MKKTIIVILFTVLMSSCVSMLPTTRGRMMRAEIVTEMDDFNGKTTTKLNLPIGSLQLMAEISLGFKSISNDTNSIVMYTYLYKSDWLFVDSISFNIDGEMFDFKSIDNNREIVSSSYIQEINYYKTDIKFLNKLSTGSDIKVRINGENYFMDPKFKSEYKSLVLEYLSVIE